MGVSSAPMARAVWGMGTNGFVGDYSAIPKEQLSDALKEKLNGETQKILKSAMTEVEKTLKETTKAGLSGRTVAIFGATGVVGYAAGIIAGQEGARVTLVGYDGAAPALRCGRPDV